MQVTNQVDENVSSSTFFEKAVGRGKSFLKLIASNPKITVGLGVVLFFVVVAIAAPLLTPYAPDGPHGKVVACTYTCAFPPSAAHPLGTTGQGQDVLSQILYGARVSLTIGFVAAFGSTALQVLFGLTAGYFGGVVDEVISMIINIFLVIPGLPLAIVLAALASAADASNKNEFVIAMVLLITSWAYGARVLRAQTLSIKEREFVAAARSSGETPLRLIFAEILPNEIALVASTFVGTFVYAVGAEVALEFLGLGNASQASWGVILFWAQNDVALLSGEWWRFIPVGLCVAFLCASLTFINFGIDEIANPNLRREKAPKARKEKKGLAA
jgi:peptide/nickel transport system permease protein